MSRAEIREPQLTTLFERGAELLGEVIDGLPGESVTIALPGGRSIVGLLRALVNASTVGANMRSRAWWSRLQFFMIDERLVPLSDPDSNFRMLQSEFFAPLLTEQLLEDRQIHPFEFKPGGEAEALASYQETLLRHGGSFSISIVGVGEDSHVAALFPNHETVRDKSDYFVMTDSSPKPPPSRMSASRTLIARSQFAMALFIGETKRDALRSYENTSGDEVSCPAKIIDLVGDSAVLTDIL